MKRIMSAIVAAGIVASMALPAFAASENTVTAVSDNGYLIKDDNLEKVTTMVPYGETVYYPLLIGGAGSCTHDDGCGYVAPTPQSGTCKYESHPGHKIGECIEPLFGCNNLPNQHAHGVNWSGCDLTCGDKHNHTTDSASCSIPTTCANYHEHGAECKQYLKTELTCGHHTHGSECKLICIDDSHSTNNSHTLDCYTKCVDTSDGHEHVIGTCDPCDVANQTLHVDSCFITVTTPHKPIHTSANCTNETCCTATAHDHVEGCCEKSEHTHNDSCAITSCNTKTFAHTHSKDTCGLTLADAGTPCGHANGGRSICSTYKYAYDNNHSQKPSIKQKWERNATFVKKIEVVKKKINNAGANGTGSNKYYWMLAITTKESTSSKVIDLNGTVTLTKSGTYKYENEADGGTSIAVPIDLELGFETVVGEEIGTKMGRYEFNDTDDDMITFEAEGNSYFEVDTRNQKAITGKVDTEVNDYLIEKNPTANMDFFNGYGMTFNKVGELHLYSSYGKYIYQVDENNVLTEVKASYDKYEETFVFKTRSIGNYVISDKQLKTGGTGTSSSSSSSSSSSGGTVVKPNPPTGAMA